VKPGLFGGEAAERVLLFLANYGEGYPREIARTFGLSLSSVQGQLDRFEAAGVVASRLRGRTRLYVFSPRYPFRRELLLLLSRMLEGVGEEERKRFFRQRTRPRRRGKPL
jgi:DNA-binding transcriptional ArsR family regulator